MKNIKDIKILYRQNITMSLWGLTCRLIPGQQPSNIANRQGWIWLGSPGWWGGMSAAEILEIKNFLASCWTVPAHPGEWLFVDE